MNTSNDLRYILYLRKSTDSADKQVQSLTDQKDLMINLAGKRDLEIVEVVSESKSAKEPNSRDGFNYMIKLIKSGEADGIITYAFDRLSRNPVDSANVKWLLQTEKIKQIVTVNRDYLPEDNALLLSIEDGMANEYIRKLRRDVRRGMVSKFKKGIYPSKAPIGYINCPYDRDIKKDEEYFPIIRKMWDMMLTGKYTVPAIYKVAINDWNLTTPKRRNSGGKIISRSLAYKIFHNKFYMGLVCWAGMEQIGKHEPMVSVEEFETVQKMIKTNTKTHSFKYLHTYGGLMRCENCNCQITAETKIKNKKTYTYYYCTGQSKYISCSQKKQRCTHRDLENQIHNIVDGLKVDDEFFKLALEVIKGNFKNQDDKDTACKDQLVKSLELAKKKKVRLMDLLVDEVIEKEDFKKRKKLVQQEINLLRLKLERVPKSTLNKAKQIEDNFSYLNKQILSFRNGTQEQKKDIYRNLITKSFLKDKKLTYQLASWLEPIEEFNTKYVVEYNDKITRSELKNYSHRKAKASVLEMRSRWYEVVNEVCTILEQNNNSNTLFQNPSIIL